MIIVHSDFETLTTEPTCVWLWAMAYKDTEIDKIVYYTGTDLESFLSKCCDLVKELLSCEFHFFNAEFDCTFIIDYLLNHGYHSTPMEGNRFKQSELIEKQLRCCHTDSGFYTLEFLYNDTMLLFRDSMKYLGGSIGGWGKLLGIPKRDTPLLLTKPETILPDWVDYVYRDVEIALKAQQSITGNKWTTASNCWSEWLQGLYKIDSENGKETSVFDNITFNNRFTFTTDDLVMSSVYSRKKKQNIAYELLCPAPYVNLVAAKRGGVCIVNPNIQYKELKGPLYGADASSAYGYVMYNDPMPYGCPLVWDKGQTDLDNYIERQGKYIHFIFLRIRYSQKYPNIVPPILAHGLYRSEFSGTLLITSIDYLILKKTAIIHEYEVITIYTFRTCQGLFKDYFDKWYPIKEDNRGSIIGDNAKMYCTNLWGKFGTNPIGVYKDAYLNEHGVVGYNNYTAIKRGKYMPIACAVTAWQRYHITNVIVANKDTFCYSDTDSIYTQGKAPIIPAYLQQGVKIQGHRIGFWKPDNHTYTKGFFACQKRYKLAYLKDGVEKIKVVGAGLPVKLMESLSWDDLALTDVSYTTQGMVNVKGGKIMVDRVKTLNRSVFGASPVTQAKYQTHS